MTVFGVRIPTGPAIALPPQRDAAIARARRLTALADILGFDYAFHGGDALSTEATLALLGAAKNLRVVAPVSVTAWHPALLARFGAVAARVSGGRFAIDLRSGPHPNDHRAEEFARIVRGLWSSDAVTVDGDHFRARDLRPSIRPVAAPEIVVSGGWKAAPALAGRVGDWYLSPELELDDVSARVAAVEGEAAAADREIAFGVTLPVVFGAQNTPQAVAERVVEYRRRGVTLVVIDVPDPEADLPRFAAEVMPLVEAEEARVFARL